MNRIRSIGRCAWLMAELALTVRHPLTKGADNRVWHQIATLGTHVARYVTGTLMQPLSRTR